MIRQCLVGAAALGLVAGVAPAQTTNGSNEPAALSHAAVPSDTPNTKARHHRKRPVETYEWTEDTWTYPVKPQVVERSTTIVTPPPVTTTTRTTTTTVTQR
ncbi:MAG TPA: hypothetical protein VKZ79_15855 [Alphaproteobacteria bacterium]|nr:hypothetical protein [Alphaproteobacteria bacterium]